MHGAWLLGLRQRLLGLYGAWKLAMWVAWSLIAVRIAWSIAVWIAWLLECMEHGCLDCMALGVHGAWLFELHGS